MRHGGIDAKLDLTAEGEAQYRESKRDLELEADEKEFYIDNLSTEAKRFEDSSNFKRMERQKKVDDVNVALIMKALE